MRRLPLCRTCTLWLAISNLFAPFGSFSNARVLARCGKFCFCSLLVMTFASVPPAWTFGPRRPRQRSGDQHLPLSLICISVNFMNRLRAAFGGLRGGIWTPMMPSLARCIRSDSCAVALAPANQQGPGVRPANLCFSIYYEQAAGSLWQPQSWHLDIAELYLVCCGRSEICTVTNLFCWATLITGTVGGLAGTGW
jgi:hypothetical protein